MRIASLLLTCALACVVENSQLPQPPQITVMPDDNIYFEEGHYVEIPCEAVGQPFPNFTWQRDYYDFAPTDRNRYAQLPGKGTFGIFKPVPRDKGVYQCVVSNVHGVAVTIQVNLIHAFIDNFALGPEIPTHVVQPGQSLYLRCIPPRSYPYALVAWILRDEQGGINKVAWDNRVTNDTQDILIITNVIPEDEQGGKSYHCLAVNTFLRKTTLGRAHRIRVTGDQVMASPYLIYMSPPDFIGVVNENVSMKCVFGGNPTPSVMWVDHNNRPLDDDRYQLASFGMELAIRDLKEGDTGGYKCFASSPGHNTTQMFPISLSVQTRPVWVIKPENQVTVVGQNVTITCRARGHPLPTPWITINGRPAQEWSESRRERLTIVSDMTDSEIWIILTLEQVLIQDSCVIQCNFTGAVYVWEHKKVDLFTNAYLNVLGKETRLEAWNVTKWEASGAAYMRVNIILVLLVAMFTVSM